MKQLNLLVFINNNDIHDLFSISELCKDGWIIIHLKASDECILPNSNTKVVLIKKQ